MFGGTALGWMAGTLIWMPSTRRANVPSTGAASFRHPQCRRHANRPPFHIQMWHRYFGCDASPAGATLSSLSSILMPPPPLV